MKGAPASFRKERNENHRMASAEDFASEADSSNGDNAMAQATQEQIDTLIEEATELTFDRACGYEAQHSIAVWMRLQQQIEYKMACAKALRNGEPLPEQPSPIEVEIPKPRAVRVGATVVIDIPEEPKLIREVKQNAEKPKISNYVREVIDSMETKFEL